jgi:putative zinc finger/helix-turn-helix YgiT family protein
MKCFRCNKGRLVNKTVDIPGEVRGTPLSVQTEAAVCTNCGFQVLSEKQAATFNAIIADAYRRRNGLLTSKQLRQIRRRLGMSQREFAEFLKVGVASVKRWETGLVQDDALDQLVRLRTNIEFARSNVEQLESRLRA